MSDNNKTIQRFVKLTASILLFSLILCSFYTQCMGIDLYRSTTKDINLLTSGEIADLIGAGTDYRLGYQHIEFPYVQLIAAVAEATVNDEAAYDPQDTFEINATNVELKDDLGAVNFHNTKALFKYDLQLISNTGPKPYSQGEKDAISNINTQAREAGEGEWPIYHSHDDADTRWQHIIRSFWFSKRNPDSAYQAIRFEKDYDSSWIANVPVPDDRFYNHFPFAYLKGNKADIDNGVIAPAYSLLYLRRVKVQFKYDSGDDDTTFLMVGQRHEKSHFAPSYQRIIGGLSAPPGDPPNFYTISQPWRHAPALGIIGCNYYSNPHSALTGHAINPLDPNVNETGHWTLNTVVPTKIYIVLQYPKMLNFHGLQNKIGIDFFAWDCPTEITPLFARARFDWDSTSDQRTDTIQDSSIQRINQKNAGLFPGNEGYAGGRYQFSYENIKYKREPFYFFGSFGPPFIYEYVPKRTTSASRPEIIPLVTNMGYIKNTRGTGYKLTRTRTNNGNDVDVWAFPYELKAKWGRNDFSYSDVRIAESVDEAISDSNVYGKYIDDRVEFFFSRKQANFKDTDNAERTSSSLRH